MPDEKPVDQLWYAERRDDIEDVFRSAIETAWLRGWRAGNTRRLTKKARRESINYAESILKGPKS